MEKTVLIIEDEPNTAEMLAEMVRLSGYQSLKCLIATTAVDLIRETLPDGIILDLMLPDLSGMDILRCIKQEPDLSEIPVVIVSTKSLPFDIRAGLAAGAAIYLTKPVSFVDLKEALKTLIDNGKLS